MNGKCFHVSNMKNLLVSIDGVIILLYIIHIFHRSIQRIFKSHPDKETCFIFYPLNRITGDSFKFRENTEKLPPP